MTPSFPEILTARKSLARADGLRAIYVAEPIIAVLALVLLAPALLLVAVVITILAKRSPLLRHARVGYNGSRLNMLKFRTMWDRPAQWEQVFAVEDLTDPAPADKNTGDERVTSRFARLCRRFSIDELPQLIHIARGEMSFVGPRPVTRVELEQHYGLRAVEVLTLRPGLTGLWQIKGRSRLTYAQRRRLDLFFVRSATPGLYLRVLLQSIPKVLTGDGAC